MRQKILYLAHVNVTEPKEVLNIGFLSLFFFPKPCSLPFYTTFASNSYIPSNFSLENFFSLLVNSVVHTAFQLCVILSFAMNTRAMTAKINRLQ